MREGLRRLLATEATIAVIGEATDGEELVRLAVEYNPNVLLLNYRLPDLPKLILKSFKQIEPCGIIIYSLHPEDLPRVSIYGAVRGLLGTDTTITDLVQAISTVAAGGSYIAKSLQP